MERVREAAGIESWILFGGSWGSTLSIAYAQEHPHRVLGMILRGIFLSRKQELDWLYGPNGAAMLFPEAYDAFLSGLPEVMRDSEDVIDTFYTILSQEENNEERRIAANAWSNWERSLSSFQRTDAPEDIDNDYCDDENLAFARIEAHYFVNKGFLTEDDYLVKESQMQKIKCIKTCIIQGRWDTVCPRKSAYDLAGMFDPRCVEVILIDNAGHSTFEPGIEAALLDATDAFGKEFGSLANR
ncbi:Proline iminopeptidase [Gracilaria domingensis]|nr:Proline iminopeptidase [Gracilaria domingensis]